MSKKDKMRDLLCAGLNELISKNLLDLKSLDNTDGSSDFDVLGKKSKVSWQSISHGEIRITIWWGIKPQCIDSRCTKPLNKNLKLALDACCSGWVERKDGLWLQGKGGDKIFDTYCTRSAEYELMSISDIEPIGYQKEGKFYM